VNLKTQHSQIKRRTDKKNLVSNFFSSTSSASKLLRSPTKYKKKHNIVAVFFLSLQNFILRAKMNEFPRNFFWIKFFCILNGFLAARLILLVRVDSKTTKKIIFNNTWEKWEMFGCCVHINSRFKWVRWKWTWLFWVLVIFFGFLGYFWWNFGQKFIVFENFEVLGHLMLKKSKNDQKSKFGHAGIWTFGSHVGSGKSRT